MNQAGTQSAPVDTVTGALAAAGSQPVWMTLDEARERSFTGEIVVETDPEVFVYLDGGVVYYAERATDAPLGRRLVDAGVIDTAQLERGMVRVGDLEHLGRLFDRDGSIDRDAVMVVTEASTEGLVADLANRAVATIRATAYRHHPSGVHRWFLGSLEMGARSIGVDVTSAPSGLASFAGAEALTIEWDRFEEDVLDDSSLPELGPIELAAFDPFGDTDLAPAIVEEDVPEATDELDPGVPDSTDEFESAGASTDLGSAVPVADVDLTAFDFEWPDGSHQPVSLDDADVEQRADIGLAFTETVDGELRFEMPPLALDSEEASADEVPDDVAAAVRRAIAAIEAAAIAPIADSVDIDSHGEMPVTAGSPIGERAVAAEPITTPLPVQAPAPFNAFAPPTLDMSAEAVYARMEAELDADAPAAGDAQAGELTWDSIVAEEPAPAVSAHGAGAVMVPATTAGAGSGDDRTSALRRLISGLRRRDR